MTGREADQVSQFECSRAHQAPAPESVRRMLRWAWAASKQVDPDLKMRVKFVMAALRHPSLSRRLASAEPGSPLAELLTECPETIGAMVWPYQCAAWDAETRFDRISEHVVAVRKTPGLALALDDKLVLADLSAISSAATLIIDRAPWFAREGHLTLSLFKDDFRAFSVAFSLSADPKPVLFIGGLQGRRTEEVLALYRDLTKDFQGMRPRDLLLEALRLLAKKIGVRHIYAVADEQKISRHKYFAGKETGGLNYDEAWLDRGAARVAATHFELPIGGSRRLLEEVPAKKRSMYRRRYEMLDAIEAALPSDLRTAERRHFDAK